MTLANAASGMRFDLYTSHIGRMRAVVPHAVSHTARGVPVLVMSQLVSRREAASSCRVPAAAGSSAIASATGGMQFRLSCMVTDSRVLRRLRRVAVAPSAPMLSLPCLSSPVGRSRR